MDVDISIVQAFQGSSNPTLPPPVIILTIIPHFSNTPTDSSSIYQQNQY
jgi:hypothetical protein